MEALPHLEAFLEAAPINETAAFPKSGAHPDKMLLLFEGGVGAIGKPAVGGDGPLMVRCELAARVLAGELGWPDLVPATVLREVPDPSGSGEIEASVQVLWPLFKPAMEIGMSPNACSDEDIWRVAAFDLICHNTDRNDTNWGIVEGTTTPRLVDHGYAFASWQGRHFLSPFAELKRNEKVPDEVRGGVQGFIDQQENSRLADIFEDAALADELFARARQIVQTAVLTLP